MHVLQFFRELLFGVDIEVVKRFCQKCSAPFVKSLLATVCFRAFITTEGSALSGSVIMK